MSQRFDGVSLCLFLISRSATALSSTAAFSNTRASRCVRRTTTSPAAACVRPASSQSWAAASPPWGPNSTRITSCVTSAWSHWAKAASRSRRTSPTATPASSSSLVEFPAGLSQFSVLFFFFFFYCGNEGGAGLCKFLLRISKWRGGRKKESSIPTNFILKMDHIWTGSMSSNFNIC